MKILIIRYSALGDTLLTTGILRYLKEKKPEVQIDFVTSTQLKNIFSKNTDIEKLHHLKKGASFSEITKLYKTLPDYDYIFDLQGNLKSKLARFFVKGSFHGVSKQSLQRRLFVKFGLFQSKLTHHVVEKYAKTCFSPLGISIPQKEELRPILQNSFSSSLLPNEPYIVVHPYASQKNKVWPHFFSLIEKLSLNSKVIVVGQGHKKWPQNVIDLSNKSSLEDLAAIIGHSQKLISTDSGPMHLAVALGKPTYAFFGPTTKEFGFYPDFKNCVVLENNNLNCRPCHIHGGHRCPQGHFRCMKDLKVEDTLSIIEESSSGLQ